MASQTTGDCHLQGTSSNETSMVTEVPLPECIGGDEPPGFSPSKFNLIYEEFKQITQSPPPSPPRDSLIPTSPTTTSQPRTNPPATPEPPTTNTNHSPPTPISETPQHVALPVGNTLKVLNSNLAKCKVCNYEKRAFRVSGTSGLCTNFEIYCEGCDLRKHKTYSQIKRLQEKYDAIQRTNQANIDEANRIRLRIYRKKQTLTKTKNEINSNVIESLNTFGFDKLPVKRGIDHEINVRSILAAFMTGTGGTDVARMMTMIGFGGGAAFDSMFFKCQKEVCRAILKRSR